MKTKYLLGPEVTMYLNYIVEEMTHINGSVNIANHYLERDTSTVNRAKVFTDKYNAAFAQTPTTFKEVIRFTQRLLGEFSCITEKDALLPNGFYRIVDWSRAIFPASAKVEKLNFKTRLFNQEVSIPIKTDCPFGLPFRMTVPHNEALRALIYSVVGSDISKVVNMQETIVFYAYIAFYLQKRSVEWIMDDIVEYIITVSNPQDVVPPVLVQCASIKNSSATYRAATTAIKDILAYTRYPAYPSLVMADMPNGEFFLNVFNHKLPITKLHEVLVTTGFSKNISYTDTVEPAHFNNYPTGNMQRTLELYTQKSGTGKLIAISQADIISGKHLNTSKVKKKTPVAEGIPVKNDCQQGKLDLSSPCTRSPIKLTPKLKTKLQNGLVKLIDSSVNQTQNKRNKFPFMQKNSCNDTIKELIKKYQKVLEDADLRISQERLEEIVMIAINEYTLSSCNRRNTSVAATMRYKFINPFNVRVYPVKIPANFNRDILHREYPAGRAPFDTFVNKWPRGKDYNKVVMMLHYYVYCAYYSFNMLPETIAEEIFIWNGTDIDENISDFRTVVRDIKAIIGGNVQSIIGFIVSEHMQPSAYFHLCKHSATSKEIAKFVIDNQFKKLPHYVNVLPYDFKGTTKFQTVKDCLDKFNAAAPEDLRIDVLLSPNVSAELNDNSAVKSIVKGHDQSSPSSDQSPISVNKTLLGDDMDTAIDGSPVMIDAKTVDNAVDNLVKAEKQYSETEKWLATPPVQFIVGDTTTTYSNKVDADGKPYLDIQILVQSAPVAVRVTTIIDNSNASGQS